MFAILGAMEGFEMVFIRKALKHIFVLAVIGAVPMLMGCQSHSGKSLLSFLFPEEKPTTEVEKSPDKPVTVTGPEKKNASEEPPYLLISHKPYIERRCAECHKDASAFTTPIFGVDWDGIFRKGGGMPGQLTLPVKELCLKCHKDLTVDWAKERGLQLHKTAAEGDCIQCHVPHQGRHPHRLVAVGDHLCVRCHNAEDKTGVPKCVREMQVTAPCLSCHNAHLGRSKALLQKDYKEAKHTVSQQQAPIGDNGSRGEINMPEQLPQ